VGYGESTQEEAAREPMRQTASKWTKMVSKYTKRVSPQVKRESEKQDTVYSQVKAAVEKAGQMGRCHLESVEGDDRAPPGRSLQTKQIPVHASSCTPSR
jgi:hypothetical protein